PDMSALHAHTPNMLGIRASFVARVAVREHNKRSHAFEGDPWAADATPGVNEIRLRQGDIGVCRDSHLSLHAILVVFVALFEGACLSCKQVVLARVDIEYDWSGVG